jgi:hypothetical protein
MVAELLGTVAGQHRQTDQLGHLQHPVAHLRHHLDHAVVRPAPHHHAFVGGQVTVGEQASRGDRVHRHALLRDVPAERVDDQAQAQHAGRAPAIEVGVANHLGQVDHGAGQRRVGGEPGLDGVEDLADLESHGLLPVRAQATTETSCRVLALSGNRPPT